MIRWLGCVLLLGICVHAQTVQSTLLALKDSAAPRKALAKQLIDEMMAQSKARQAPSHASVERFSQDLTTALLGRDITTVRANVMQKAIADVLHGKGSTYIPATNLRETLNACGIDESTVRVIVQRFIDIGQEVRGPDDMPRQPAPPRK